MQHNWINLLIAVLAALGLGYYIYTHVDWNPPKSQSIWQVQVNGKRVFLTSVKAVQIPPAVYESMADNPKWKEHLLGEKKKVLLFTWDGCPYERAFKHALEKVFQYRQISQAFEKDIVVTGQSVGGSCHGPLAKHCPLIWLIDHCMHGICIINPQTREVIEDHSKNARQVAALLMAYASWKEPFFAEDF